jgi:hypothetical protein
MNRRSTINQTNKEFENLEDPNAVTLTEGSEDIPNIIYGNPIIIYLSLRQI